ncbi:hypothetical protein RSA36_17725 [Pantoea stewartii]|uniref:Uncharacterized protein n=1 Tax=Pantoea stewartii TaxID=66269 RepID=A0AB34VCW7_9GAMM|nr:hypothetical protein RSA30_22000 [Pantoea stewartii]KTS96469.1 hypothetical protein RSA13_12570 [Pantoea stewartii]KTT06392.1 hypothetical protein RSA36_17725 [Pantoea stewartii]
MTQSVTTASTLKGNRPLIANVHCTVLYPACGSIPVHCLDNPFAVLIRDARPQCDYEFIKDIFAQGQINILNLLRRGRMAMNFLVFVKRTEYT